MILPNPLSLSLRLPSTDVHKPMRPWANRSPPLTYSMTCSVQQKTKAYQSVEHTTHVQEAPPLCCLLALTRTTGLFRPRLAAMMLPCLLAKPLTARSMAVRSGVPKVRGRTCGTGMLAILQEEKNKGGEEGGVGMKKE